MAHVTVRDRDTLEILFIKSDTAYKEVVKHGHLHPRCIYTCYPSLEHNNDACTLHGDELLYICRDGGLGEAVPSDKPLTQLVEEKGGLNEDGTFKDSLEVKEPKRAKTPDDEVLDCQPLDEGCTDNTCSLDACSGGECTDAGVMATKIAQQEAQKFAVGAREMKEGEEFTLTQTQAKQLALRQHGKTQPTNLEIKVANPNSEVNGEDLINVNFDDHYKQAKTDKVSEPIDIIEALEVRLIKAGVDINEACNICRGLKYVLRGSFKEGEDVQKELRKFYNYTHRARTGSWLGGR